MWIYSSMSYCLENINFRNRQEFADGCAEIKKTTSSMHSPVTAALVCGAVRIHFSFEHLIKIIAQFSDIVLSQWVGRNSFWLSQRRSRKKKNNIHHTFHCLGAVLASHKVIIHMRIFFCNIDRKSPSFRIDRITVRASEILLSWQNLISHFLHFISENIRNLLFSPPFVHTPSCSDMEGGGKITIKHIVHTHTWNPQCEVKNC